jgi:hypothetical protein
VPPQTETSSVRLLTELENNSFRGPRFYWQLTNDHDLRFQLSHKDVKEWPRQLSMEMFSWWLIGWVSASIVQERQFHPHSGLDTWPSLPSTVSCGLSRLASAKHDLTLVTQCARCPLKRAAISGRAAQLIPTPRTPGGLRHPSSHQR